MPKISVSTVVCRLGVATIAKGGELKHLLIMLFLLASAESATAQPSHVWRLFRCDNGIYTSEPQAGIHSGCTEMPGGKSTASEPTKESDRAAGLLMPP